MKLFILAQLGVLFQVSIGAPLTKRQDDTATDTTAAPTVPPEEVDLSHCPDVYEMIESVSNATASQP
jgi:hypothetical protein